ncbi:zinc finger protein 511 [Diachasma alloeum]|uniref:zinc finger protein 511 n=1 Tax=Diachasma alloeum TaxID=454923 RepID=UPI00073824FC|nr:zinc finger protein 511 [Diachasma alloeum]
MQVSDELDRILRQIGIGARPVNDSFFDETHKSFGVFTSLGVYHADEEELCHPEMKEFSCNGPGCSATFKTLVEFEMHYNGCHGFTCIECRKIRPTERLLDIHIQETHDNFFKVLAEKKPMYQCFVSDCYEKFSSPTERRDHSIKIHKFPSNYRYDESLTQKSAKKEKKRLKKANEKKKDGIKDIEMRDEEPEDTMEVDSPKKNSQSPKKPKLKINKNQKCRTFIPSLQNPTSKSSDSSNQPPVAVETSKVEVKPSSAALAFIPRQLMHKSYSKVLTKNMKMEREVLESENMMDLAEALPQ